MPRPSKLAIIDKLVKMITQKKKVSLKRVNVRMVHTIKVIIGGTNHLLNKKVPKMDNKTTISGQMISTNKNPIVSCLLLSYYRKIPIFKARKSIFPGFENIKLKNPLEQRPSVALAEHIRYLPFARRESGIVPLIRQLLNILLHPAASAPPGH